MSNFRIELSWQDVYERACTRANEIVFGECGTFDGFHKRVYLYGIPNGGIPAALEVARALDRKEHIIPLLTERPEEADVIVDDVLDSGKTMEGYSKFGKPFAFLVHKPNEYNLIPKEQWPWISFPWERMAKAEGPEDNIRRILQFIGEDPTRDGLKDTPTRVVRSFQELYGGYNQDPKEVIRTFILDGCDEMVVLRNVEFTSMCEHHMMPFLGQAHIAYIPNGKVIGISKLARVLEIFSRRLQVQERLTEQVTNALMEYLQPKGAACVIQAKHLCMACRGVLKQHSEMVTSSLKGVFLEKPGVREEFLNLVR